MKYIVINEDVPPRQLKALSRRVEIVNGLPTVKEKKEYIKKSSNNTWVKLKSWLEKFSSGKCWYCEAKVHRATSDVDHFRPKAGITCDREPLTGHDGYYWLAYDWKNFRLSCQRCNRPENDNDLLHGKANEFPLVDESARLWNPRCNNNEQPKLLDPCVESDTQLLSHLADGTIIPTHPKGTVEQLRAELTCKTLGLNGFGVPEEKRKQWGPLNDLIQLAGNQPTVVAHLQRYIADDAEYTSFFRAALRTHRDKDWVEALLESISPTNRRVSTLTFSSHQSTQHARTLPAS